MPSAAYDPTKLTAFYDRDAERRDAAGIEPWKAAERARFLEALRREGKRSLLELGAGPGRDGLFFKEHGLDVLAADLSGEMVRLCREKGLEARVVDLMALPFEAETFDGAYALNSLLHVPKHRLEPTLRGIFRVLKPGGLFYLGLYGGADFKRQSERDPAGLERFFASYSDGALLERVRRVFELVAFRRLRVAEDGAYHVQSLVLRRPSSPP